MSVGLYSMARFRPTSRRVLWTAVITWLSAGGGCIAPGTPLTVAERAVAAAAGPILELDPHANWTACFNRLVELGPASVCYLARQPLMHRRAAPDDLRVALHISLLRLLANRDTAPRLSANCFETTLDLLHFDLKARGRRVGTAYLAQGRRPRAWHDLYPADFDHRAAADIDVEADRRAMLRWWRKQAGQPSTLVTTRPLTPRPERLWRLLSRRYADRWTYQPELGAILCAGQDGGPEMIRVITEDYNLVRAACIWLGSSPDPAVQDRLIEMIASSSPVVGHNARFALRHSRAPRIRAALKRFEQRGRASDRAPIGQPKAPRALRL
jgi:hypothetical protein